MQPDPKTKPLETLDRRKGWRVWWQLTRPHTLTASFVPVTVGTVLAAEYTRIHFGLFFAMLIACLLIQTATNMFNEYFDFKRGLDNEHSVGIGGAIVREGVEPKTVYRLAFILVGVSLLLGAYICMKSSWWIAVIGSLSIAVGYLYTGGPYPIAYTPLGELFSGFFMGVVIILISVFIQTGEIQTAQTLVSVPVAILIGAINLANNIRDMDGDKKSGRKTLAILLGRKRAIGLLAAMFAVSYLWLFLLIATEGMTPWILLALLSLPTAYKAVRNFIGKTAPKEMLPAMKATARTNTQFGMLMAIGIILSYLW